MIYPILLLVLFFVTGCDGKPQVRHYTEITIESASTSPSDPHIGMDMGMGSDMPTANDAMKNKLTWDTPKGWVQEAGGPMRLATLKLANDPEAFDCSIIALPGAAGGLEANLKRWMGQIQIDPTPEAFSRFIKASKGNIYDFAQLQSGASQETTSMIAAMIEIDDTTVFVKFKASIAVVKKHRAAFLTLVKSVRRP